MATCTVTKKALAASMKALMAEMDFGRISVGDICGKCGMSRKSFYYHFRDKYDLVNWIFYTEFISRVTLGAAPDGRVFLADICAYFHENRAFYVNAFGVEGQNSFTEFFAETLHPFVFAYVQERVGAREYSDFFCTFYTDALRVAITQWLKQGAHIPPDRFAQLLEQAFSGIPAGDSNAVTRGGL
jgi:probable dihydroxyacetone kinase regulator